MRLVSRTSQAPSIFLGFALACATAACGGGDDDDNDDASASNSASAGETGDEPGQGITDCTPPSLTKLVCQAGQYCADAFLGACENGCLSNDNCAADQVCEKAPGEDVGSCQNTGSSGPTEAEFCSKLLTCDPSGTMAQCSMVYAGTNATCHKCIVDGNCGDINGGSCNAACGF